MWCPVGLNTSTTRFSVICKWPSVCFRFVGPYHQWRAEAWSSERGWTGGEGGRVNSVVYRQWKLRHVTLVKWVNTTAPIRKHIIARFILKLRGNNSTIISKFYSYFIYKSLNKIGATSFPAQVLFFLYFLYVLGIDYRQLTIYVGFLEICIP